MQKALEKLGIKPTEIVSLEVLLGEHFNGKLYGMDRLQMERLKALREIVATYEKTGTGTVEKVTCAKDAVKIVYPQLKNLSHEEVVVIFLNNMNRVLHVETLYKGSTGEVAFSARDIVSRALGVNATALVVAHNHPSGNPEPSRNDISQTENLRKACDLFEISLLDHIVIAKGSFFSFADESRQKI